MSLNHFSTDLQETPWWPHQQQQMEPTNNNSSTSQHHPQQFSSWPSHHHHLYHHHQHQQIPSMFSPHNHPAFSFNLNQYDNNNDDQESVVDDRAASATMNLSQEQQEVDKEPMFEKPLTPSDVGKLNRLVIPKQHAEKYFPLGGGGDSGDKGLLLSFEDESGKCWRFRYSYWNSSQSYVLTKGWSRYVKDKRLDAGDVILFERHRTDTERLFIGWRRRGAATMVQDGHGGGWSRGSYSGPSQPYPAMDAHGVTVSHQPDCLHAGSLPQNQAAPVGNSRTLRLFGVNLECQLDESEPSTPDGSSLSSQQGQAHTHHLQQLNYAQAYSSDRHNHMDITFSKDVNQMMRNRQE